MDNQRIALSKRLLKDTLLKLLNRKDLLDITVRELCEESEINRSTFYRHYDNISDILNEIVDELAGLLTQTNDSSQNDPANSLAYISDTLSFFRDHREYDPLICSESFTTEMLYRKMEDRIAENLAMKNSPQRRYVVRFLLNGSYGLIKEWIQNGRKEDVEVISKILFDLCAYGVR